MLNTDNNIAQYTHLLCPHNYALQLRGPDGECEGRVSPVHARVHRVLNHQSGPAVKLPAITVCHTCICVDNITNEKQLFICGSITATSPLS